MMEKMEILRVLREHWPESGGQADYQAALVAQGRCADAILGWSEQSTEKAAARVREWLVAHDSFYGREAGNDDVIGVEAIYGDEGEVLGYATLSLDDLRTLVNAPPVESYDDRLEV